MRVTSEMPHWMIFRAQTPPNFNFSEYAKHSSEPIRYDAVTVVEADSPGEAVEALIGATGVIVTGFAAIECELVTYGAETKLGRGGVLRAPGKDAPALPNGEPDEE